MEWVNKIHPFLRWLLVVPSFVVAYYFVYLVLSWTLLQYVGPRSDGIVNTVIYWLQQDVLALLAAIYCSTKMAPRGKIVVASVYLILALILVGVNLSLFITGAAETRLIVILATIGTPIVAGVNLYIVVKERIDSYTATTETF